MKLMNKEVMTSAELMEEFFSISRAKINRMSEKERYEKIYEYLIKAGAKKKENRFKEQGRYNFLELEGELYMIPKQIFAGESSDYQSKAAS